MQRRQGYFLSGLLNIKNQEDTIKKKKEEETEVHVVKRVNIYVHVAVDSARLSSWIFVKWLGVFMIIFQIDLCCLFIPDIMSYRIIVYANKHEVICW